MWRTGLLILITACTAGSAAAARWRLSGAVGGRAGRDGPPERIVSLAPALTETCCALGLRDRLVGRSRYCDWPPEIRDVPDVGALIDPSLERILLLKPDLILVAEAGKDLRGQLDSAGLAYLVLPNRRLADVFESIRRIAEATRCEVEGDRLIGAMRQRFEAVRLTSAGRPARRVMLCISASRLPMPLPWVAGPDSYLGELVALAGHRAVPSDLGADYGEISFEQVLRTDPDAIIEFRGLAGEARGAASDPAEAWGTLGPLRAARERRVYLLHGTQHVTPGPRCVETLKEIARVLTE